MLYSKIEYIFSKEMLSAYIRAMADLNIFILAWNLYSSNLAILQQQVQLVGLGLFNSYNIFSTRVEVLARKVNEFNQVYIQGLYLVTTSYSPLDIEDLASFTDILNFINAIRDRLDNVDELNLTSNMPPTSQEALSSL